jgi:hypothetical protein
MSIRSVAVSSVAPFMRMRAKEIEGREFATSMQAHGEQR